MKSRMNLTLSLFLFFGCSGSHPHRDPSSRITHETAFVDDQASCTSFSDRPSPDQDKVIHQIMATHVHRLNHLLWHATRNSWSELSKKDRRTIQKLSPEWGKHAPLCPLPKTSISETENSASGEEFLSMHHRMIDQLRLELTSQHLPCIAGWKEPPAADNADWPVPAGSAKDSSKSAETFEMMQAWAKRLHDPAYLQGKSLSYVGTVIEFTIHNFMHMRWARKPSSGDDFSPLDTGINFHILIAPSSYDDPKYDWLGNPYSAHVNEVFWKLHGWVDDTIPLWLKANGFRTIADACEGKADCYEWKSRWIGAPMGHRGMPGHGDTEFPMPAAPQDPELARVLEKISRSAGFGTPKFDSRPRAAAPGGPKGRDTSLDDPDDAIRALGPCPAQ